MPSALAGGAAGSTVWPATAARVNSIGGESEASTVDIRCTRSGTPGELAGSGLTSIMSPNESRGTTASSSYSGAAGGGGFSRRNLANATTIDTPSSSAAHEQDKQLTTTTVAKVTNAPPAKIGTSPVDDDREPLGVKPVATGTAALRMASPPNATGAIGDGSRGPAKFSQVASAEHTVELDSVVKQKAAAPPLQPRSLGTSSESQGGRVAPTSGSSGAGGGARSRPAKKVEGLEMSTATTAAVVEGKTGSRSERATQLPTSVDGSSARPISSRSAVGAPHSGTTSSSSAQTSRSSSSAAISGGVGAATSTPAGDFSAATANRSPAAARSEGEPKLNSRGESSAAATRAVKASPSLTATPVRQVEVGGAREAPCGHEQSAAVAPSASATAGAAEARRAKAAAAEAAATRRQNRFNETANGPPSSAAAPATAVESRKCPSRGQGAKPAAEPSAGEIQPKAHQQALQGGSRAAAAQALKQIAAANFGSSFSGTVVPWDVQKSGQASAAASASALGRTLGGADSLRGIDAVGAASAYAPSPLMDDPVIRRPPIIKAPPSTATVATASSQLGGGVVRGGGTAVKSPAQTESLRVSPEESTARPLSVGSAASPAESTTATAGSMVGGSGRGHHLQQKEGAVPAAKELRTSRKPKDVEQEKGSSGGHLRDENTMELLSIRKQQPAVDQRAEQLVRSAGVPGDVEMKKAASSTEVTDGGTHHSAEPAFVTPQSSSLDLARATSSRDDISTGGQQNGEAGNDRQQMTPMAMKSNGSAYASETDESSSGQEGSLSGRSAEGGGCGEQLSRRYVSCNDQHMSQILGGDDDDDDDDKGRVEREDDDADPDGADGDGDNGVSGEEDDQDTQGLDVQQRKSLKIFKEAVTRTFRDALMAFESVHSWEKQEGGYRLLDTLLANIVKYPDEPKFRRFRSGNEKIQQKILSKEGGDAILRAAGFVEDPRGGIWMAGREVMEFKWMRKTLREHSIEALYNQRRRERDAMIAHERSRPSRRLPAKAPSELKGSRGEERRKLLEQLEMDKRERNAKNTDLPQIPLPQLLRTDSELRRSRKIRGSRLRVAGSRKNTTVFKTITRGAYGSGNPKLQHHTPPPANFVHGLNTVVPKPIGGSSLGNPGTAGVAKKATAPMAPTLPSGSRTYYVPLNSTTQPRTSPLADDPASPVQLSTVQRRSSSVSPMYATIPRVKERQSVAVAGSSAAAASHLHKATAAAAAAAGGGGTVYPLPGGAVMVAPSNSLLGRGGASGASGGAAIATPAAEPLKNLGPGRVLGRSLSAEPAARASDGRIHLGHLTTAVRNATRAVNSSDDNRRRDDSWTIQHGVDSEEYKQQGTTAVQPEYGRRNISVLQPYHHHQQHEMQQSLHHQQHHQQRKNLGSPLTASSSFDATYPHDTHNHLTQHRGGTRIPPIPAFLAAASGSFSGASIFSAGSGGQNEQMPPYVSSSNSGSATWIAGQVHHHRGNAVPAATPAATTSGAMPATLPLAVPSPRGVEMPGGSLQAPGIAYAERRSPRALAAAANNLHHKSEQEGHHHHPRQGSSAAQLSSGSARGSVSISGGSANDVERGSMKITTTSRVRATDQLLDQRALANAGRTLYKSLQRQRGSEPRVPSDPSAAAAGVAFRAPPSMPMAAYGFQQSSAAAPSPVGRGVRASVPRHSFGAGSLPPQMTSPVGGNSRTSRRRPGPPEFQPPVSSFSGECLVEEFLMGSSADGGSSGDLRNQQIVGSRRYNNNNDRTTFGSHPYDHHLSGGDSASSVPPHQQQQSTNLIARVHHHHPRQHHQHGGDILSRRQDPTSVEGSTSNFPVRSLSDVFSAANEASDDPMMYHNENAADFLSHGTATHSTRRRIQVEAPADVGYSGGNSRVDRVLYLPPSTMSTTTAHADLQNDERPFWPHR